MHDIVFITSGTTYEVIYPTLEQPLKLSCIAADCCCSIFTMTSSYRWWDTSGESWVKMQRKQNAEDSTDIEFTLYSSEHCYVVIFSHWCL